MTGVEILVSAGLALAGGALSAVSAAQQGAAANATAKFRAQTLEEQARLEQELAKQAANDERRQGSRVAASTRAALAGSGVTSAGAPLLAQSDLASQIELSARRIEVGGNLRGRRLRQDASLSRFSGRSSRNQGLFSAGSSLLGGFTKAFNGLEASGVFSDDSKFLKDFSTSAPLDVVGGPRR